MGHQKFDLAKLERLNDPGRLESLDPEVMWTALGSPGARSIAEIGAGTGLFAAAFASLAPDAVVYAVDAEPAMLEWMTENRTEVASGRIVPVLSTEASVPLEAGIADVVAMINVHHELADPDAIYAEAYRLLAPAGHLLVVDWAPRETPKGPPLTVRATAAGLVRFVERAGFAAARVHDDALPWHTLVTAVREA